MSLFGESPGDPVFTGNPVHAKSIIGDSLTPGASASASLFDDGSDGTSPWNMPTPRKAPRSDLIKQLLTATDVPESYIDAYDILLESGHRIGGNVDVDGLKRILGESGIGAKERAAISNLFFSNDQSLRGYTRSEFNCFLALVGLAQEGDDVTLDCVDDRRKNLPEPSIPFLKEHRYHEQESQSPTLLPQPDQRPSTPPNPAQTPQDSPATPENAAQPPINDPEVDPWASPEAHKEHNHPVENNSAHADNITPAGGAIDEDDSLNFRTTNTFAASGAGEPAIIGATSNAISPSNGGGWGGFENNRIPFQNPEQNTLGDPFNASGSNERGNSNGTQNSTGRSIGRGGVTVGGPEEEVLVTLIPEKEGIFLFQHRNYEVKSPRRGTTVVRRYSDFVWLLDCLHKRYPFRQLPLLPPKRIAGGVVNGRHLSADAGFIEKRRRGLARFVNSLVRHPVLSQEQLVIMFLTVQTELAVWKKQATISVQEEFVGKPLPPGLEDSLPQNLQEIFDTVRTGVKKSAEIYINMCAFLERLSKRNLGLAADSGRFAAALHALTECTEPTYAIDTNDVPLLNEGIKATAKHLSTSQSLLEDEARAWDEGVLEDLKRQRDALVSMRELFDRRDRLARDNIPQLEKRIKLNESKLVSLRQRPQELVRPGEIEKAEQAIVRDNQAIVDQHVRGIFIQEALRDELLYFQSSQYHITHLHQDWSQERVKYAELQAENWRTLGDELEGMPVGE